MYHDEEDFFNNVFFNHTRKKNMNKLPKVGGKSQDSKRGVPKD